MNIIGSKNDLGNDVQAKAVCDIASKVFADDSDALIYYKFPFYKGDISSELIEAKLLLVSRVYGLCCFELLKSGGFETEVQDKVDTLYNEISSRMLKHQELRKSRNVLKYGILTIIIGENLTPSNSDDYTLCKLDELESVLNSLSKVNIPEEVYSLIVSCIDGTTNLIKKKDRPQNSDKRTKGVILDEIQNHIASFDIEQKQIATIEINSPQRIRGLAGSGKTVVLAYKAAIYHARHPEQKILYTYYTKSLGGTVRELIRRAHSNFFNKEPDWSKIVICHAWGSENTEGVYYNACVHNGYKPLKYFEARNSGKDPFAYVCEQLLKRSIEPEYDLILIDEGQDFSVEFYRLCYKLCNSPKKICWAYDDFQNIFDVKIQNEKETFGNDKDGNPYVDFSKLGIECDQVLKKCYRTPRLALIHAFALGLGIYNDKVLQRLETNEQWESLGFKVEQGGCQTGDSMVISRPEENSPSYSNDIFSDKSICVRQFANYGNECDFIISEISRNIKNENLQPTDICVICIDQQNISSYFAKIEYGLIRQGIFCFNLLTASYSNTSFFVKNRVTLSTVNKAKGNECGMVFICGVDVVFANKNNVILRDRLFTSMTRTKGWLYLTGCSENVRQLIIELKMLLAKEYKLVFNQPEKESTKNIESLSIVYESAEAKIAGQIRHLREIGLSDADIQNLLTNLMKGKH